MRVLVVEDDPKIAADVAACLSHAGYSSEVEGNGEEAWFRGDTEDYDAIVLDLGLPQMDGLSILKKWRANGRGMPVLVLSARGTWSERVEGIDAGADDYLPKPFRMEELLARLRAVIRRTTGHSSTVLEIEDICIDTRMMQATRGGRPLALTPAEYRLLAYLMHHCGRTISQGEIVEHVFAQNSDLESNAVEVLVGRLRKKVGADFITTRRGFGYIVNCDTA